MLPVTPLAAAEIVDVPGPTSLARPAASIVATSGSDDVQATEVVRSCVEASEKVPVAVNGCVAPLATVGLAGVTAIEASTGGATVSVVLPLTVPELAVMVVVPTATAVARPPAAMVAAAGVDDVQVTEAVMSCVELSAYVAVAVNCCVRPAGTLGVAGVTAIETSAGTVSVVLPLTPPEFAEMVLVPVARVVATPAVLMVATVAVEDAHATVDVRFCVEPSVYVPVAVNGSVRPFATLGFAGVTAMDVSAAAATVSVVLPTTLPEVAEIVLVPVATAVARPAVLMVATVAAADAQLTVAVRFWVEPSV